MALITLRDLIEARVNADGLSVLSTDPSSWTAGFVNATIVSIIQGLFTTTGFSDSSTIEVEEATKKWANPGLIARILNQISGNFYTATGTNAYSLVAPASNTNLFPNSLVSGKSVFMFLIPNSNTNSNLTLSIPTVTTSPLKIFKSNGTSLFGIGEFEENSIAICFYDETLDGGVGGFKAALSIDKSQASSQFAPITGASLIDPTANTPFAGDNSTRIATTAFVQQSISDIPMCYVEAKSDQNFNPNTETKVNFTRIVGGLGDLFNTTTMQFKPTKAGWYDCYFNLLIKGNANIVYTVRGFFKINGQMRAEDKRAYCQNYSETVQVKQFLYFNGTTDYLEVWVSRDGTASQPAVIEGSYFNARFIR